MDLQGTVRYTERSFDDIRREIYSRVIEENNGNYTAAAMTLRIARSTFFDQLRSMGLRR
jgi:transcriptional regulator of acetoin/glycerol metabolism